MESYIFGVIPSVFDSTIDDFINIAAQTDSALSLGEQLFTARGS